MNSGDAPSRALPVEPGAQPLASLIARVEAATGPDRELDKALWYKLIFDPALDRKDDSFLKLVATRQPAFTASLDAALALVERVLPGWEIALIRLKDSPWEADIEPPDCRADERWRYVDHRGATPALAMLRALLKAIQAQPIRHDARDGSSPQSNEPSK